MQQRFFEIQTKDGLKLHAVEWKPDIEPKAAILLIHGIGEHTGRYQHVAQTLTDAGFSITGFDLRGHGQSEGIRGHSPSYDAFMEDINTGLKIVRETQPGKPVFLYGHSLGGNLTLYYSVTQKSLPSGAIVTSPALGVTVPIPPVKIFLGKIMYSLFPTFQMKNGLDPNDLARDTKVGEAYTADPLVHPYTTARLGLDLLNSGNYIIEHAANIQMPILLMQGTSDKLVSPELTKKFADLAPAKFVTYKEWQGYYHELHNEPEKADVLKVMIDWLNSHI